MDYFDGKSSKRPESRSLTPLQAYELQAVVNEFGDPIVCDGESDDVLARDGMDEKVFAVLSKDSDLFLVRGIRFLHVSTIKWKKPMLPLKGVVTPAEEVAAKLGFTRSSPGSLSPLPEFAFLAGKRPHRAPPLTVLLLLFPQEPGKRALGNTAAAAGGARSRAVEEYEEIGSRTEEFPRAKAPTTRGTSSADGGAEG